MLYEIVTVEVRPGAVADAVERCAETALSGTGQSRLLGFWTTEIGRVNELLSLWSHPDGAPGWDGLAAGDWLGRVSSGSDSSPSCAISRRAPTAASTSCAATS